MNTDWGIFAREPDYWVSRLPRCARRVLLAGWEPLFAKALQLLKSDLAVVAVEQAGYSQAGAAGYAVHLARNTGAPLPYPAEHFDCIMLPGVCEHEHMVGERVRWLLPYLAPEGFILCAVRNASYVAHPDSHALHADVTFRGVQETLQTEGLSTYCIWSDPETTPLGQAADAFRESPHDVPGRDMSDPANRHRCTPAFLVMAVRPEYNPVKHARALFTAGRPGWAHEILDAIPAPFLQHPDMELAVAAERQLCLLAWMKAVSGRERLELFYTCQALFYRVMAMLPCQQQALRVQAEAWHVLGDDAMASRLLRSLLHVEPDNATREQLARYTPGQILATSGDTPPKWAPSSPALRILFVMHPRPHYGLDVLYDGLCEVLGDASVLEYPWKPTLHGQTEAELAHYPCSFNRNGTELSLSDITTQLARGDFSCVLWGDLECGLDTAEAHALVRAAGNTPVFMVDQQDDPLDNLARAPEYLGIAPEQVAGYFKREMLACYRYPENTFPLPFAYADAKVPETISLERPNPLFWAGHRLFGLRRLYLEYVEQAFGIRLDHTFTQDKYARGLAHAQIGLNIFGGGFDTVRYWEVPAHGCMLLSERLPIRIPHNFRDGESAVFFDDLGELEAKLRHYMAHPQEAG